MRQPYFTIDFDGDVEFGLIRGELAYFPFACALWGILSIIDNVVYFQTSMPALVSAGFEAVIRDWYVRYRTLKFSTFEFSQPFGFFFSLLFSLSTYGV